MAVRQMILPANRAFNSNGLAVPGAVAKLYETGTTTPVAFYSDETLATSLGTSITANGAGRFSNAYQDGDTAFRLVIEDPDGVELEDIDPFYFGVAYFDGTITLPGNDQPLSQVVSGLQVIWTGGLNFSMSAGTYYIDGTLYSAEAQTITLTAADGSNDRIDVLAVNTSGTLVKVTGTAAANPSEPDVDPSTQLKLKFVLVPAGGTAPDIGSDEVIYEEADGAGEWTPSVTGSLWTTDNTTEPDSGTKCINGASVLNTSSVTLNKGSTLNRDDYESLILRIKSKTSNWGTGRLRLHFQNANSARVGNIVSIENGTFGFSESNVSSYQQVVIPLTAFNIPAGSLLQKLYISSSGAAFSVKLDNIKLQAATDAVGGGTTYVGISEETATALFCKRSENLADLASAATARTNLDIKESLIIACSDETTALTTGTAKVTFRMPYAFTLSAVRASVTTAPTGAALTVDINESGTTILSTKLTIDAGEKTSTTAATAAVISDSALADDAEITIDIDQIGSVVAGAGLKVALIGRRA
jgi:hypothetical protein